MMTAADSMPSGNDSTDDASASQRSLTRRVDGPGLRHLVAHLGALLVTGWLVHVTRGSGWLVPALFLHGIVLVFLFAPLHETIHRTAFRSRRLNDAVAWFCGAVLLLPPRFFRAFHFAHHRFTQDPAHDPELVRPKPHSWGQYLWVLSGVPYWVERVSTTIRYTLGNVAEPFVGVVSKNRVVREARILVVVYVVLASGAVALGSDVLLYYWVMPVVVGQPFLRGFLLAEHTGCPMVADMRRNSRTTISNWLVRRLAWNMPYHTAHHVYPGVPFHGLPELHRRIQGEVGVTGAGYIAVQREIVAGF
jgi:fatty acid desaturase